MHVHGELFLGHASELEQDVLMITFFHKLKVLDRGTGNASVEIQYVFTDALIPARGFVDELCKTFIRAVALELLYNVVEFGFAESLGRSVRPNYVASWMLLEVQG